MMCIASFFTLVIFLNQGTVHTEVFKMEVLSMVLLSSCLLVGPPDHVSWSFSQTSSGQNVSWTSPSAIQADGEHYELLYTVDEASVLVTYLGITFGPIDVTDLIPPENLETFRDTSGPCPLDFGWTEVSAPVGQDPPAIRYDWKVEINAKGIVTFRMENMFLGQAEYNLGWPWGSVTVTIIEGTIDSTVVIDVVNAPCVADIDGSGNVDIADLLEVIANWGLCIGCPADTNQDDVVDVTDLLLIVGAWGPCPE